MESATASAPLETPATQSTVVDESESSHESRPARTHVVLVEERRARTRRRLALLPALPIATALAGAVSWQLSAVPGLPDVAAGMLAVAAGWVVLAGTVMGVASLALCARPMWFAVVGLASSSLAATWLVWQVID